MTWLLSLTICLLVGLMALVLLCAVSLRQALPLLRSIQRSLSVWDTPKVLTQPVQEPGTSWAMSDAELAAKERELLGESRQRQAVTNSRARYGRSLKRTTGS